MDVKLIRIHGEDVICDLVEKNNSFILISQPIVAVPLPQEQGKIGFAPWSPLMSEEVESVKIRRENVTYITEVNPDMRDQYVALFSKVITPPSKNLIL